MASATAIAGLVWSAISAAPSARALDARLRQPPPDPLSARGGIDHQHADDRPVGREEVGARGRARPEIGDRSRNAAILRDDDLAASRQRRHRADAALQHVPIAIDAPILREGGKGDAVHRVRIGGTKGPEDHASC
jgi:hypothetical protein